jgi:phage repressor protein C with HTH and peptisase S24 domain
MPEVSTQGERLSELQRAAGFATLADFARAASVEPGTARQQFNRDSVPADVAPQYVDAARRRGATATVEWLLYGTGHRPERIPAAPERALSDELSPIVTKMTPVRQQPGPPDVPVWASVEGGMDGALILTPDPVDFISRNERMLAVKNPFAFVVVGGSMSPAIEHGDKVVINPSLKPRVGNDCVFVQDQEDGTFLAIVKRFIRMPTADHWHVRQFEPREDFKLARKLWPKVFVVDEIRRAH